MKIFVQIASYRDPQLVPTIKDMLANAKRPKNLVLGISRQFSESDGFDNLDEFRSDKRFKILDIPQVVNRYILLSTKPNPQTKIIQKLQSILMMKGL